MKRNSKSAVLDRRAQLAKIMKEQAGYEHEYQWYWDNFKKSEKTFQSDKTVIYQQWIIDNQKDVVESKIDIIQELNMAKKRAIDGFDVKSEISAIKLKAQINGLINKQGEIIVNVNQINTQNTTIDITSYSTDELKGIKEVLGEN